MNDQSALPMRVILIVILALLLLGAGVVYNIFKEDDCSGDQQVYTSQCLSENAQFEDPNMTKSE